MKETQLLKVKEHLLNNGSITSLDAFKQYGITRLAAIIYKLRATMPIKTISCTTKNRYGNCVNYAKYVLAWEEDAK